MGVGEIAWGERLGCEEVRTNLHEGLDQEDKPACHLSQHVITDLCVCLLPVFPRSL